MDVASLGDLIVEVDRPNCRAMFDAWAPALQGEDIAEPDCGSKNTVRTGYSPGVGIINLESVAWSRDASSRCRDSGTAGASLRNGMTG